jgi:hypothetical protein
MPSKKVQRLIESFTQETKEESYTLKQLREAPIYGKDASQLTKMTNGELNDFLNDKILKYEFDINSLSPQEKYEIVKTTFDAANSREDHGTKVTPSGVTKYGDTDIPSSTKVKFYNSNNSTPQEPRFVRSPLLKRKIFLPPIETDAIEKEHILNKPTRSNRDIINVMKKFEPTDPLKEFYNYNELYDVLNEAGYDTYKYNVEYLAEELGFEQLLDTDYISESSKAQLDRSTTTLKQAKKSPGEKTSDELAVARGTIDKQNIGQDFGKKIGELRKQQEEKPTKGREKQIETLLNQTKKQGRIAKSRITGDTVYSKKRSDEINSGDWNLTNSDVENLENKDSGDKTRISKKIPLDVKADTGKDSNKRYRDTINSNNTSAYFNSNKDSENYIKKAKRHNLFAPGNNKRSEKPINTYMSYKKRPDGR